jgi:1-acyl-sn-glycerol-3-phosphate acyltransferase
VGRGLADANARFDPDDLDARDPALIERALPLARWCARYYFRLQVEGFDQLPRGPVLYVANHNGGMAGPDVGCTLLSLFEARGVSAPLYALTHDFAMRHVPPFGRLVQRFGALRATPQNALRALERGAQVLVYPGGELDAYRHSRRRNEIVLGERTGFIRVAKAAGVPIVPIIAQGAHRSAYIFFEGDPRRLGLRWARVQRFPAALALPWGIALSPWLPYLPLPFSIRLRALPALHMDPQESVIEARERVRGAMQRALDQLAARAR